MASDGFTQYIKDIVRYPLLTKEQEILLSRQVQAWIGNEEATKKEIRVGRRAYEKLINCNLRLVVSIAKRYTPHARRSEMFDIVQEGNMGLAHGIKKFDPERGYALSTYVYWWIRQSITRFLSTHDRMIRLPSHAVEILGKLRHWKPVFEGERGRPPTLEECAEFFTQRAASHAGPKGFPIDFLAISVTAILLIVPLGYWFDFTQIHELFSASIILIAGLTLPHILVTYNIKRTLRGNR